MRVALFFFVCIPVRFTLALIAMNLPTAPRWALHIFAAYCILVALGFVGKIIENPPLGGFGGPVWWQKHRYVHVVSYVTSAILLYTNVTYAYIPLLFDALFGLLSGTLHYVWR